jgi:hypothetical protein
MPSTWDEIDPVRRLEVLQKHYAALNDNWENIRLRAKLWAHFNERQRQNLEALTHKWTKEHQ